MPEVTRCAFPEPGPATERREKKPTASTFHETCNQSDSSLTTPQTCIPSNLRSDYNTLPT